MKTNLRRLQQLTEVLMRLDGLLENQPLYKDSGLWQVRTDDMETVLFQQLSNETLPMFIMRVSKAQEPQVQAMWAKSLANGNH